MASSSVNTSEKQSSDSLKESTKNLETSNKSKEPSSKSLVEDDWEYDAGVHYKHAQGKAQVDELSPDPIEKISCASLAAIPISGRSTRAVESLAFAESRVLAARPFEEILMQHPCGDVPSGTFPKPGDGSASSTGKS